MKLVILQVSVLVEGPILLKALGGNVCPWVCYSNNQLKPITFSLSFSSSFTEPANAAMHGPDRLCGPYIAAIAGD